MSENASSGLGKIEKTLINRRDRHVYVQNLMCSTVRVVTVLLSTSNMAPHTYQVCCPDEHVISLLHHYNPINIRC